ncbi:MAG: AAA family ATPase [Nitrososphaerales archaeon]
MTPEAHTRPKLFAFSGAHSCGKSTTINDVLEQLTQEGYSVDKADDVARDSSLPLNTESNFHAQLSIMDKHIQQEINYLRSENTVVLLDRTVYDHIAYATWLNQNQKLDNQELRTLWDLVEGHEVVRSYDAVFYLSLLPLVMDPARSNSIYYQKRIQDKIHYNLERRVGHERIVYVHDTDRLRRCEIISREIIRRLVGE